jgi:hypothetical protein
MATADRFRACYSGGSELIWGKSFNEQEKRRARKDARVGTEKWKFVWFPDILPTGRWVWLERCLYRYEKEDPRCYVVFQYYWKLIGRT